MDIFVVLLCFMMAAIVLSFIYSFYKYKHGDFYALDRIFNYCLIPILITAIFALLFYIHSEKSDKSFIESFPEYRFFTEDRYEYYALDEDNFYYTVKYERDFLGCITEIILIPGTEDENPNNVIRLEKGD